MRLQSSLIMPTTEILSQQNVMVSENNANKFERKLTKDLSHLGLLNQQSGTNLASDERMSKFERMMEAAEKHKRELSKLPSKMERK